MSAPIITVVMSVFNGDAYVAEAIDSILTQSCEDFEFIIIDDASTDNTPDIIRRYRDPRIRHLRNDQNLGLTCSLNVGIAMATAPFFARQDADDRSHPERFARQLDFLKHHPEIAIVGSQIRLIDEKGQSKRFRYPTRRLTTLDGIRWQSLFDSPFVHSSVMCRTYVLRTLEGYNEDFTTSQDFELWSRLLRAHNGTNLPDVLIDFRVHRGSLSRAYTRQHIRRVEDVIRGNFAHYGLGSYDLWIRDWLRLYSPNAWGDVQDVRGLVDGLCDIRGRFIAQHSDPRATAEITLHVVQLLGEIAAMLASSGRNGARHAWYAQLKQNWPMAVTALPTLAARVMRAKARLNKASTVSSW